MSKHRTTVSFSPENYTFLKERVTHPNGFSESVNDLVTEARVHGDLAERIKVNDAKFELVMKALAKDALDRTGKPFVFAADYQHIFGGGCHE